MKTFCLALFLFFSLGAVSNDTLTRAQVYNFNVGDTFDYSSSSSQTLPNGANYYGISYARFVITATYYSASHDTLYIGREQTYPLPVSFDTLIINNLNKYEYYFSDSNCLEVTIDTSTYYYGRTLNSTSCTCYTGECYSLDKFAGGLGIVFSENGGGGTDDGYFFDDISELIYYSRGANSWGTPYEIVSGMQFINYLPIPEECATWIRTVYDFYYGSTSYAVIQEKITEGNKVPFDGHAYIPLFYSYYNFNDSTSTEDSMLGYFRNDTLNQSAYLYQSLTDTPYLTYNFRTQVGENGICSIDTLSFSTGYRTRWDVCDEYFNPNQGMIEGVGGSESIWPVQFPTWTAPGGSPTYYFLSSLTSFCVCGTVLYSTDSFPACDIPAGIKEVPSQIQIQLFPNPSTGTWQLTVDEDLIGNKLQVYDAEGRLVFQSEIRNPKSEITFNASPGVYFLQIASPQVNVVRKLVKL